MNKYKFKVMCQCPVDEKFIFYDVIIEAPEIVTFLVETVHKFQQEILNTKLMQEDLLTTFCVYVNDNMDSVFRYSDDQELPNVKVIMEGVHGGILITSECFFTERANRLFSDGSL